MSYSRRNFLKAAGSGVVLTAVTGELVVGGDPCAPCLVPAVAAPFASEKATFLVNGKAYAAEYEARTTLWEVISMKLGLTGTNRSCNRASCGACSVLVDGTPFYSCHTLATEAVGKKILTIEGVGDEKNMHPLQRIGHTRVAADCGFCTAGWVVTAKGLLDKNPNPNEDQVKAALAGHICRCSAYPNIIRTVMDRAAVMRGSKMPIEAEPESVVHIKMPMVRDYSTSGGHLAGQRSHRRREQDRHEEVAGISAGKSQRIGQAAAAAAGGFHSEVHRQGAVRQPRVVPRSAVHEVPHLAAPARPHQGHRHVGRGENAGREIHSHLQECAEAAAPNVARGRILPEPLPRELNLQGEVAAIVVAETEDLAQDAADAIKVTYEVLPFASTAEGQHGCRMRPIWDTERGTSSGIRIRPRIFRTRLGRISAATSKQDSPKRTWSRNSATASRAAFRFRCSRAAASPNGTATD